MPDDSTDGTEPSFRVQFTRFAEEIRQLVIAVFGGELDVVATHVASRSRIFAEVPLTVAGENLARLKIDVWCCLDSYQQFLAVEESTYQLIAQVDRAPIMRFEYERGATSKPPVFPGSPGEAEALEPRGEQVTIWLVCMFGRELQRRPVHGLQPMQKHWPVGSFEEARVDPHLELRAHSQQVSIEGAMVDRAQGEAVRHDRLSTLGVAYDV